VSSEACSLRNTSPVPLETRIESVPVVSTGKLGHTLNHNALTIGLGLEQIEYELEQFPGLIYHSLNALRVALLQDALSSRAVLISESTEIAFEDLSEKIQQFLAVD